MSATRDLAKARGLDKLTDEHLAQLERATANMKRHTDRLPKDLTGAHEAAHIYQAKGTDR
jgi:hypothetical protein